MSRTSCIMHAPKQAIAIVRQDYYQLMERDACAAALLNLFEYWANAAIASDPGTERPWVGNRPMREFEQMLLGISTDKQIRKRLALIEARGFIQVQRPQQRGAAKAYRVMVPEIQQALVGQMTEESVGQITERAVASRLDDRRVAGQTTEEASVKQPPVLRSFDPALKKSLKEFKKENDQKKEPVVFEKDDFQSKPEHSLQPSVKIGCVKYSQPPESIDLSALWETNPGMAKMKLRAISIGHKRLDMVAHGFGHWWVGPGLNDFDEHLIQACRHRKRKFQQSDSIGDAKTYLNNMLRNGDWGNLALRCEEANDLKTREKERPKQRADLPEKNVQNPFQRSKQERRESALGLARFKVSQGLVEQALVIARQFNLSMAQLGISDRFVAPR